MQKDPEKKTGNEPASFAGNAEFEKNGPENKVQVSAEPSNAPAPIAAKSKHPNRFPKSERLCSERSIKEIFAKGKSLSRFPFRVLLTAEPLAEAYQSPGKKSEAVQVLISVPKRNIKKAVQRNQIKRRIREAWRLNRSVLFRHLPGQENSAEPGNSGDLKINIALVYTGREVFPYAFIEKNLILALAKAQTLLPGKNLP
ncbi:MAG: ribonuclease P protein component [Bacteroidota bacterium]